MPVQDNVFIYLFILVNYFFKRERTERQEFWCVVLLRFGTFLKLLSLIAFELYKQVSY